MTHPSTTDGICHRVDRQLDHVRDYMLNVSKLPTNRWRTLGEIEFGISSMICAQQTAISARLRDLRKPEYGGYTVEKRLRVRDGEPIRGLWEYRITEPERT